MAMIALSLFSNRFLEKTLLPAFASHPKLPVAVKLFTLCAKKSKKRDAAAAAASLQTPSVVDASSKKRPKSTVTASKTAPLPSLSTPPVTRAKAVETVTKKKKPATKRIPAALPGGVTATVDVPNLRKSVRKPTNKKKKHGEELLFVGEGTPGVPMPQLTRECGGGGTIEDCLAASVEGILLPMLEDTLKRSFTAQSTQLGVDVSEGLDVALSQLTGDWTAAIISAITRESTSVLTRLNEMRHSNELVESMRRSHLAEMKCSNELVESERRSHLVAISMLEAQHSNTLALLKSVHQSEVEILQQSHKEERVRLQEGLATKDDEIKKLMVSNSTLQVTVHTAQLESLKQQLADVDEQRKAATQRYNAMVDRMLPSSSGGL